MSRVLRRHEVANQPRWLPTPLVPPPGSIPPDPQEVADALLAQARAEAETLLAAARAEAESIRQEAHAAGRAAGEVDGQRQYEARLAELTALEAEMNAEREDFFTRAEPGLVRLAVTIAEKVLAQQLALKPEIVVDLTRAHLKRLREREVVHVRANPQDIPLLAEAKTALLVEVDGVRDISLEEDRRVGRGGIVLEAAGGSLDARLSSQVELVRKALTDATEGAHDFAED